MGSSATHVDLRLSLRSFKAAFTRLSNTIEGFINEGLQEQSLKIANDYSAKYKLQLEKLAEANDKVCATNPSDIDNLYEALDVEHGKFIKLHACLTNHIVFIEKSMREAAAFATPTSGADLSLNVSSSSISGCPGKFVDKSLQPFTLTKGHNPQELRQWCKAFTIYYDSGSLALEPLSRQRGFLNLCLDTDLVTDLESFVTPATPILGPEGCLSILEDRFWVFHPTFNRRVALFNITKNDGEDSSSLLTRVQAVGLDADVELLDREGILTFVYLAAEDDKEIRKEVSRVKATDLATIRQIVEQRMTNLREDEAAEIKTKATKSLAASNATMVAAVTSDQRRSNFDRQSRQPRPRQNPSSRPRDRPSGRCIRCARSGHRSEECFAKNLVCHYCRQEGHITPACRSRLAKVGTVGAVVPAAALDDGHPEVTPRLPISLSHPAGSFVFPCFPDTGSGACIISKDLVSGRGFAMLPPSREFTFSSITGQRLRVVGRVVARATVVSSGAAFSFYFEVTPDLTNEVIVGYKALRKLCVISESFPINKCQHISNKTVIRHEPFETTADSLKDDLCSEFNDVLDGKLPETPMVGDAMDIFISSRSDVKPTKVTTARPVPLHFQPESEALVAKLLAEGIITKVDVPTEWCAPAFFVKKPSGGLRLVTDFTGLNRCVKRPVHPFPAPQDIVSGLSPTSKIFAKLDALSGYFQVPLTTSASFLTTFLLPSGMYRYLRAPMGLSSSSDEFCRRSDAVFAGLPGIRKLVDDILVEGNNLEDLERKLRAILDRCRQHGFVLSRKKFEIGPEVEFAGFVVSSGGVRPCPRRLEAIADFPVPTNLTSLRGFLGLCNQLAVFIPDLAALAAPLRGLLKKNVPFCWLPDHDLAFEKMKRNLVKTVAVHHFDSRLHTKLITDASKLNGIGYILIQTSGPDSFVPLRLLQCGSRALTPAERNYATIELECLGIQWALKKSDYFLRGLEAFNVVTDHRPLVGVFSKPLSAVDNPRLVRIIEKTSPYSFGVSWTSGKTNVIADALSRNPVGSNAVTSAGAVASATTVPAHACIVGNAGLIQQLVSAASSCTSYRGITEAFKNGVEPSALPANHPARRLLSVWPQLSLVNDGLLCVDAKRIFVPIACRKSILNKLHVAHPGITKMYHTARTFYFWPGLKNDIVNLVSACDACQVHRASLPIDNLVPTVASAPMELVSVDLFQFGNSHYLVLVDRFSNFPLVSKLSSLTSKAVIDRLRGWFLLFGFPKTLRSDGGPQFRSEFRNFCDNRGILHQVSSPYNSQSNGSAESGVKILKATMKKCHPSCWDEAFAMLRHACDKSGRSSSSLFFGRTVRSSLPTVSDTQPLRKSMNIEFPPDKLRHLCIGQQVRIQDRRSLKWSSIGTIISRSGDRSYVIKLSDGSKITRNRRFLRVLYK